MATIGGQIGNNNGGKNKDWQQALRKTLIQYADDRVQAGQALAVIAQGVVQRALEGDMACIQEIGNRMDGKPAQSLSISGEDDKPLITMIKMVIVQSQLDDVVTIDQPQPLEIEHTRDSA